MGVFLPLFGIFFVAPFIVRARISGQHENWKESVGDSFFCVDENRRRRDISDILKRSEMTLNAI